MSRHEPNVTARAGVRFAQCPAMITFLFLDRLAVKGVRNREGTVAHGSLEAPRSADLADPSGPARGVLIALALCVPFWVSVIYMLFV